MRRLLLPIFVLALAGCADETDRRDTSAVGADADRSLEQRVATLEQRLDRIERTAVVVGPDDPEEGTQYPGGAAGQNEAGAETSAQNAAAQPATGTTP